MLDFHIGGHTCSCPRFPPEGSAGLQMMSLLGCVGQSLGLHKTKLLSIDGAVRCIDSKGTSCTSSQGRWKSKLGRERFFCVV